MKEALILCFPLLQVTVRDRDLTSDTLDVTLTLRPENDELPQIINTDSRTTYIEEAGPVNIVNQTASIRDVDNLAEHQSIQELRVTLVNPEPFEDRLIVNGVEYADEHNFTAIVVCGDLVNATCTDVLRSLRYDNTLVEPTPRERNVVIEVRRRCYR